jgi:hypothetical protein
MMMMMLRRQKKKNLTSPSSRSFGFVGGRGVACGRVSGEDPPARIPGSVSRSSGTKKVELITHDSLNKKGISTHVQQLFSSKFFVVVPVRG